MNNGIGATGQPLQHGVLREERGKGRDTRRFRVHVNDQVQGPFKFRGQIAIVRMIQAAIGPQLHRFFQFFDYTVLYDTRVPAKPHEAVSGIQRGDVGGMGDMRIKPQQQITGEQLKLAAHR